MDAPVAGVALLSDYSGGVRRRPQDHTERMGLMKKIPCSYEKCWGRRIHHERQDTPRGVQLVEVNDIYEGAAYCSFTCAIMDGAMSLRKEGA